jgi:twitching motility protein PilT
VHREAFTLTTPLTPFFLATERFHASDLHVKAGSVPRVRINGALLPLSDCAPFTEADAETAVLATMDEDTRAQFEATNEADYAVAVQREDGETIRFRANAYRSRGTVGLIARLVGNAPRSLATLGLPPVISELALKPRGLVLVTGPTGSGKTTTLAAMVDLINEKKQVHILTIEDPIEILHTDKQASVNQRQLRSDTADFNSALKAAMRQDPDVILIGEMRDADTVGAALSAAQTGHFVMSTLHTTDAAETVNRIIDFFPPHEQKQVRLALSQSLQGIVCQRLVPTADGGRACVMEIMVRTNAISEAIADPDKTAEITDLVRDGGHKGMRTFDQHLLELVLAGTVTIKAAMAASSRPHDLSVALKAAGVDPNLVDL